MITNPAFKRKSKLFSIDIHTPQSKRTKNSKRKDSSMRKNDAFIICKKRRFANFIHLVVWHTLSFAIRNASAFLLFWDNLALEIFKQVSDLYLWHFRIVILHCNFVWMATYFCIGNVTLFAFIPDSIRRDFFPTSFLPHTTNVMKDDE